MRLRNNLFPYTLALEHCLSRVSPIGEREDISIEQGLDRVLAEAVVADRDVPPFARSAVDGYAVRADETSEATPQTPRVLRVLERLFAGQVPSRALLAGTCTEVATGAPLPSQADAVVMVEETVIPPSPPPTHPPQAEGAVVAMTQSVAAGENVHPQGADMCKGMLLLEEGAVLGAAGLGVLAALGRSWVSVYRRPRVAVLITGSEIKDVGAVLAPGQVYNINAYTLTAVIQAHGGDVRAFPILHDELDLLLDAVEATRDCDILVVSGGSSVGRKDLVADVARQLGEVVFHGVALKPGRPTLFAVLPGRVLLGVPGNPASCLTIAYLLLVPTLRRMAHLPPFCFPTVRGTLAHPVRSRKGVHQVVPVRLEGGRATSAFKESGDITSYALAHGFIEIPAEVTELKSGEAVEVRLFDASSATAFHGLGGA